MVLRMFHFLV